jgi:hypothetical protein
VTDDIHTRTWTHSPRKARRDLQPKAASKKIEVSKLDVWREGQTQHRHIRDLKLDDID